MPPEQLPCTTVISSLSKANQCRYRAAASRPVLLSIVLIVFLLLPLETITTASAQVDTANRHQYISDRLCNRIYNKLQSSHIVTPQQLSSALNPSQQFTNSSSQQHNDTVAYLNQRDGAKYPFWVQCFASYESGGASGSAQRAQQNGMYPLSGGDSDDHFSDLGSIFDAWADDVQDSRGASGGAKYDDSSAGSPTLAGGRQRQARPQIQDDRYDYLVSVTNHCGINRNVKQCQFFKIGLFNQQVNLTTSPSSASEFTSAQTTRAGGQSGSQTAKSTKCPVCGLNDLNCDNVSQCTSDCGQIKSINYPLNYGNNHRCRWSVRAPNGFYVNLSVIDFDIPSANNASKLGTCIFDYLTLIDGYTGKRIGCYCNENLPPAYIVSPWNELIIQFDTNSETTGRGFYFEYQFMKLELNERIKSQLASGQVCLQGWQYFRSSCYKAFNEIEPLQWYDAENKCNQLGEGLDGHLVSILDKEEMLVILYWLTNVWNSTRYREYYIGLIDVSREGLYRWSDNNPMSYTDWELKPMLLEDETPAQPDGGAYEDCTVIRYNSFSRTSNWHDVPCSLGKHYHSRLEKGAAINFKWDYVSGYICKIDSISVAPSPYSAPRSKIRRPLFSNDFRPSIQTDHLIEHLASSDTATGSQRNAYLAQGSSDKISSGPAAPVTVSSASAGTTTSNSLASPQLSTNKLVSTSTGPDGALIATLSTNDGSIQQQQQLPSQKAAITHGSEQQQQAQQANKTTSKQTSILYLSKLDDNRYFVCDNLEVISTVLRCDGVAHCRDGSDESNGCDQDCLDWQFKCANGRCISIGHYCDFSDDCGDGSDESRCERHRCKLNEFRCQSGQCIPAQQRCDLLPDCRDSSDEGRSCTIGSNCNSASTFQCYNGLCIPQYAVCDFQIDCPGKFHEDEDAATCELLQRNQGSYSGPGSATVAKGTKATTSSSATLTETVAVSAQSAGGTSSAAQQQGPPTLIEPNNATDLEGQMLPPLLPTSEVIFYPANRAASVDTLPDNLFRCKSGNTIDASQRCLFEFDKYGYQLGCRDVSHLADCTDFECPERDYVKCSNSYCIPWRYVCDGKWDCIMGDDELGCARYVCPGQYKCANQSSCILVHQLCDGHRQCPMGDDEWFCDLQCPLGCDCIGQSVNCRGANLTSVPSNYIPKAVRKLDLSYNKLGPNLSNSNFDAYHDLGELILSHNEIEVLTPRKFHQLRNLYKLDLSYNRIHSVKRGAFAGLRRVTQLLLESNQQLFLLEPEAFLGLSSLQMLNISSSQIQSLKRNTFDGLTSLRHLLLRSNMILAVEDGAFRSLSSLVSLDMRGNDIKHFTKLVFSDLKSLRNLSTDSFKFCCLMNHQIPADKCLPPADEISDCEDLLSSVTQRTCIWIAGGFACLGNLIVIIWRYRDRLGQQEREYQHVNSTLLLSLGFSDLLMGIYLIIIALVDSWYRGRYIENADKWRESPLCNLCGFLSTISSTVSVLTLVFIAYNRYLEICYPFKIASKFTLGYTHRLIRFSWLLALTIATLPLVVWPYFKGQFYAKSGVCLAFHITDQRAAGWLYSIIVSPCINLASFLIIFMCYIRIYVRTRQAAQQQPVSHNQQPINHHILVLTILTHFVAFSPPMILGFMSLAHYTPPAAIYSWIAVLVLPVNSAIDPMIYTIPHIRKTVELLIDSYRMRKSGALSAAARAQNQQSSRTNGANRAPTGAANLLAKRNVPPGYVRVTQFIGQHDQLNVSHLVDIALEIARDLEDKHREGKVYARLRLEDIYVSDAILETKSDADRRKDEAMKAATTSNGSNNAIAKLAVFVTDYDGYRPKRSQLCGQPSGQLPRVSLVALNSNSLNGHNHHVHYRQNNHYHRHHRAVVNCECSDVARFGDILFKLIQLFNSKKLESGANDNSLSQ